MSKVDFIKSKLGLLKKDDQSIFDSLADPLSKMAESSQTSNTIHIPADGNWFNVSFDAVEQKSDRLVISAKRTKNGVYGSPSDPDGRQYIVEFEGSRAAYLRGMYKHHHRKGGWPYVYWDIRSYTNHPQHSR
jgi:hypothetical protein